MISQGVGKGGTITIGLKPLGKSTMGKNNAKENSAVSADLHVERDFTFEVKKKKKTDSVVGKESSKENKENSKENSKESSKESPIVLRTANFQN
jgi:hypothetical protein